MDQELIKLIECIERRVTQLEVPPKVFSLLKSKVGMKILVPSVEDFLRTLQSQQVIHIGGVDYTVPVGCMDIDGIVQTYLSSVRNLPRLARKVINKVISLLAEDVSGEVTPALEEIALDIPPALQPMSQFNLRKELIQFSSTDSRYLEALAKFVGASDAEIRGTKIRNPNWAVHVGSAGDGGHHGDEYAEEVKFIAALDGFPAQQQCSTCSKFRCLPLNTGEVADFNCSRTEWLSGDPEWIATCETPEYYALIFLIESKVHPLFITNYSISKDYLLAANYPTPDKRSSSSQQLYLLCVKGLLDTHVSKMDLHGLQAQETFPIKDLLSEIDELKTWGALGHQGVPPKPASQLYAERAKEKTRAEAKAVGQSTKEADTPDAVAAKRSAAFPDDASEAEEFRKLWGQDYSKYMTENYGRLYGGNRKRRKRTKKISKRKKIKTKRKRRFHKSLKRNR